MQSPSTRQCWPGSHGGQFVPPQSTSVSPELCLPSATTQLAEMQRYSALSQRWPVSQSPSPIALDALGEAVTDAAVVGLARRACADGAVRAGRADAAVLRAVVAVVVEIVRIRLGGDVSGAVADRDLTVALQLTREHRSRRQRRADARVVVAVDRDAGVRRRRAVARRIAGAGRDAAAGVGEVADAEHDRARAGADEREQRGDATGEHRAARADHKLPRRRSRRAAGAEPRWMRSRGGVAPRAWRGQVDDQPGRGERAAGDEADGGHRRLLLGLVALLLCGRRAPVERAIGAAIERLVPRRRRGHAEGGADPEAGQPGDAENDAGDPLPTAARSHDWGDRSVGRRSSRERRILQRGDRDLGGLRVGRDRDPRREGLLSRGDCADLVNAGIDRDPRAKERPRQLDAVAGDADLVGRGRGGREVRRSAWRAKERARRRASARSSARWVAPLLRADSATPTKSSHALARRADLFVALAEAVRGAHARIELLALGELGASLAELAGVHQREPFVEQRLGRGGAIVHLRRDDRCSTRARAGDGEREPGAILRPASLAVLSERVVREAAARPRCRSALADAAVLWLAAPGATHHARWSRRRAAAGLVGALDGDARRVGGDRRRRRRGDLRHARDDRSRRERRGVATTASLGAGSAATAV